MSKQYLHFTLGPVQGFVSQARRTRDFWAGSFLLSWLTAHAMKAVQDKGATIVMPFVNGDELLERIKQKHGEGPSVGSLPNNFIAEVPESFDGIIAKNAVQKAWKALADAVWKKDELAIAGVSKDLWDEQIENFWDMAWVIADSQDGAVLAQRKNWRNYMPPESLGDKCTMMGEWQELSGADKPNPRKQKEFWDALKQKTNISDVDIRPNERLCAIAYVKRRFVHGWQEIEIDGKKVNQGWMLPASVPSTSYMAAVHWLEDALSDAEETCLEQFHQQARSDDIDYGEWSTDITCIKQAIGNSLLKRKFASLDGRYFFESELDKEENKALKGAMKGLREQVGVPSPFYAVLMMDGDSLGETKKKLAEAGQPATALSESLAKFTKAVPDVVAKHNGFLIYAGGDDVLAILPLEDALPCAADCRVVYQKAFGEQKATISAAIEYAHMKLPLTMILKDAHKLLDDVAKNGTGRDAVACRVWKPGGEQQTWAMPWEMPEHKKGDAVIPHAVDMLDLIQEMEQRAEKKSDVGYSSKLLYSFRETLTLVMPDVLPEKEDDIQELAANIKALQLDKLLETTYLSSGLLDGWKEADEGKSKLVYVQEQIQKLMPLMRVYDKQGAWSGLYSSDGALLLRFLAQKGVER